MNENILLFSKNAKRLRYEPHNAIDNKSPIIFHNVRGHKGVIPNSNIHENIELFCFFGGRGRVRCNSDFYDVTEGDIIAVNSYVEHQLIPTEAPSYYCVIIDAGFCKINGIDIHRIHFTPFIRDTELTRLFHVLREEYNGNGDFKDTAVKSALLSLLLHLCRHHSQPREDALSSGNQSFEYVCMAVDFIKRSFDKKLTVDDVAEAVGLSKYHFLREFKRVTGHTVIEYINIIRCEYAAELLKSGKYNIKEVAVRCGFDDISYFTKVFKKNTSQLPSKYKVDGD